MFVIYVTPALWYARTGPVADTFPLCCEKGADPSGVGEGLRGGRHPLSVRWPTRERASDTPNRCVACVIDPRPSPGAAEHYSPLRGASKTSPSPPPCKHRLGKGASQNARLVSSSEEESDPPTVQPVFTPGLFPASGLQSFKLLPGSPNAEQLCMPKCKMPKFIVVQMPDDVIFFPME